MTPSDPRQIDGFRLSEVLGRGGQGSVYLAEDSAGGKAAVKVLRTSFAGQPAALRRFTREAETTVMIVTMLSGVLIILWLVVLSILLIRSAASRPARAATA
ncbi:hypothetical protein [Nonomuraea sp. NPDC050540]|uniref:hypothetical protein n=1 Tax=Nonomuraea sp. NPDC050540 TaxID=3364367 RepID=UPI0037AEA1B8